MPTYLGEKPYIVNVMQGLYAIFLRAAEANKAGVWQELMEEQTKMGHCGMSNPAMWPEELRAIIQVVKGVKQGSVGDLVR